MTKEAMAENPEQHYELNGRRKGKVTARTSFDAMRAGDASAKAVDKCIKYLAAEITNAINILADVLCIGRRRLQ